MSIEIVRWKDPCDVIWEGDFEPKNLPMWDSIGEVIYEDKEVIVLRHANSLEEPGCFDTSKKHEGTAIFKKLIVRRTKLKKAK